jgi:protoporphyrinogen oxidase
MTSRWGIVGGGLLGMTLAWELSKRGHCVSIFESGSQPGGLARPWQLGNIIWDRHYHVTLLSDSSLRSLLEELDLDRHMRWSKTRTGFYSRGVLYPFSNAMDFARFPLLNLTEKIRFGLGIIRAARLGSPTEIEGITVEEWLKRLSGEGVFEKLWRPLLRCKLGDDYQTTAASFIWATIHRLYAARRSGLREEMFGYLPGGYARMLETFGTALRTRGVCIHLNARIRAVESGPNAKIGLRFQNETAELFDRIVITTPAPIAAALCPELTSREIELLRGVEYLGIICASLLLSRSLSTFYVTNIVDNSIPLTGIIEMSTLVDREMFQGRALVYLPRYLRHDHEQFDDSDGNIQEELISALRSIHPSLRDDEILACRISRARYVFPRPIVGSSSRRPPIDTSVRALHILNASHIINGTLNVNETVKLAQQQARRLHDLAA